MRCVGESLEKFIAVDVISSDQIVTSHATVFDVDLTKCKVSDLEFSSSYEVNVEGH